MRRNVSEVSSDYNFYIDGVSYIGKPKNNTVMYISKKVEYLLACLEEIENCLIFVENGVCVPSKLSKKNCFVFSDCPQYAYAKYIATFAEEIRQEDMRLGYNLTESGYYIGSNVSIGEGAYIEPGTIIGHHVIIGSNATILAGSVIKNAIIGDDFLCNENAVIGGNSFTLTKDKDGNNFRIPALGRVIIGNNVEVGVCNDIERGACGDTIIEDCVKLAGLIYVGHEAHLKKNTEITAGCIIAGFVSTGEHAYLGVNSSVKNRLHLGRNSVVGMGANVLRSVEADCTVIGNPAKILIK